MSPRSSTPSTTLIRNQNPYSKERYLTTTGARPSIWKRTRRALRFPDKQPLTVTYGDDEYLLKFHDEDRIDLIADITDQGEWGKWIRNQIKTKTSEGLNYARLCDQYYLDERGNARRDETDTRSLWEYTNRPLPWLQQVERELEDPATREQMRIFLSRDDTSKMRSFAEKSRLSSLLGPPVYGPDLSRKSLSGLVAV